MCEAVCCSYNCTQKLKSNKSFLLVFVATSPEKPSSRFLSQNTKQLNRHNTVNLITETYLFYILRHIIPVRA